MRYMDRTNLELDAESFNYDFDAEAEGGWSQQELLNEGELDTLAADMLEVGSEQEMDHFLGRLLQRVARQLGRRVPGGLGSNLGRRLKRLVWWVPTPVGAGQPPQAEVPQLAGEALGLKLEGLSQEDREFEVARHFVRLATDAMQQALSMPHAQRKEVLHPRTRPEVGRRPAGTPRRSRRRFPWLFYGSPVWNAPAPTYAPLSAKPRPLTQSTDEDETGYEIEYSLPVRKTYFINASTRRKGTATNEKARRHAQTTRAPRRYGETMKYVSNSGVIKTVKFKGRNPRPRTGKMQAGHIQAKQLGGSGTDTSNIFPQNPQANMFPVKGRRFTLRGSHRHRSPKWIARGRHGIPMSWREWEDKKARKADKYRTQNIQVDWTGY